MSLFLIILLALGLIVLGLHALNLRKRLKHQLEIARSELQHAYGINNARNLFLASLSHELRTPISGIIGAAQLFDQTSLNNQQAEYVRMINSASTVLLEIIDDMLTFSRINTDKIQLVETNFDIRKDIDDLLLIQSVRLQNRSVALVIDIADNVPKTLVGDRGKLNQVLLNIVGNAIKYTQEGSITIEINSTPDVKDNRICLTIVITDTGMGMDREMLENAFQPFNQSKKRYLDNIANSGMGLGLAICKRLVTAMKGDITIQSKLGEGTSVTINICFEEVNNADVNIDTLSMPNYLEKSIDEEMFNRTVDNFNCDESMRPMMVLVVEDDEINRLVCTRYLATQGHHPIVVANHVQAKKILHSGAYMPDVMLMDINLVGMSGVQLATVLRQQANSVWQHIPIIFMSADVSGQAENTCKGIDNSCFMEKPFSPKQLHQALCKAIQSKANKQKIDVNKAGFNNNLSDVKTEKQDSEIDTKTKLNASSLNGNLGQDFDLIDLDFVNQEILDLGSETVLEMLNIFRSNSVTIMQNMSKAVNDGDYSVAAGLAHKLKGSAANLGLTKLTILSQKMCDYLQQPDFISKDIAMNIVLELGMLCHPSSDQVRSLLLRP